MNKAYLLVFCLLLTSFTGCMGGSEDNDDLTSEIENLTNQNESLNELLTNQTEDNNDLSSEIANLTAQIEKLNKQIQDSTEDNEALSSEIANLTTQIQSLNEQIQNGTEDNDDLTSEIANLTAQIQSLNEQILNLNEENERLSVYQPRANVEFKNAVYEWVANSISANSTYGHINTWDTSLVTNMAAEEDKYILFF